MSEFSQDLVKGLTANPLGALFAGAGTLLNIGQGIAGTIRRNKLNNQWDALNAQRPVIKPQRQYADILRMYQTMQSQGLPGYGQMQSNIEQATAGANLGAERGAISSNAYGSLVGQNLDKELQALHGLGIEQAQYKAGLSDKIAGAEQGVAQEGQRVEDWNTIGKWTTKMNQLESQMGANLNTQQNAMNNMFAPASNFFGTQYYINAMKEMRK